MFVRRLCRLSRPSAGPRRPTRAATSQLGEWVREEWRNEAMSYVHSHSFSAAYSCGFLSSFFLSSFLLIIRVPYPSLLNLSLLLFTLLLISLQFSVILLIDSLVQDKTYSSQTAGSKLPHSLFFFFFLHFLILLCFHYSFLQDFQRAVPSIHDPQCDMDTI